MKKEKVIYFFLPDYPESSTGGIHYHMKMYEYFKKKSVNVKIGGNRGVIRKFLKYKYLKPIGGLLVYLTIPKNSILILTNTEYVQFFLPVLLLKFLKKHKIYIVVHHLLAEERKNKFKDRFECKFIKLADYIVTVSEASMESLKRKSIIIDDIPVINPGMNFPVLNEKIHFSNDVFNILFVGSIEERKGLIYAVKSLEKLKGKNIILNVVGEVLQDNYFNNVKKEIDTLGLKLIVLFHGKVNQRELENIYLKSDIFLFLSLWEGYGMVIAEALSFGLPIIGSNIPTMHYFVDDGVNGFIVDPLKIDAITEKIELLRSNTLLRKKMSDASLLKARGLQSWNTTCQNHLNLISKLM